MNWTPLEQLSQLDQIKAESVHFPILIFKHSTRCSISKMANDRLNRIDNLHFGKAYFLDLIKYREVSNRVAEVFSVYHESPQVLIISGGECIYDASHMEITADSLAEVLA